MPCRSPRRDWVRWSAPACSALSSAKCAPSAALIAAERLGCRRAIRPVGLAQPFEQLPHDRLLDRRPVRPLPPARRCGRRSCRSAGRRLPGRLGGRSHREVGGRPRRRPVQRPGVRWAHRPRLQFRLERTQQGFDRIEVNGDATASSRAPNSWRIGSSCARAGLRVDEAVELVADFDKYRLEGLSIGVGAAGGGELGVEIAQKPFDRAGVDRCGRSASRDCRTPSIRRAKSSNGPGSIAAGGVRASNFLIEPRRDLLQAPLDRGERRRGGGAFDLSTGFREKRGHLGGLEVGSGTYAEPLDAVSQFADLALQPLKRRRAQRGRSEEIAHFFRLPPDAVQTSQALSPPPRGCRSCRRSRGSRVRARRLPPEGHALLAPRGIRRPSPRAERASICRGRFDATSPPAARDRGWRPRARRPRCAAQDRRGSASWLRFRRAWR